MGFVSSMGRKDNDWIESFHNVIKKEWIFHEKYRTRAQAQASILG